MSRKSFNSSGEGGFAAALFLFFTPVILILLSYGVLRLSQLQDLRWLRENCRAELIPAQTRAGESIQMLLRMNGIVRVLKIEKIAAQTALAAATLHLNIPAIRAAERWLSSVRKRQAAVRLQQKAIIRMADLALMTTKSRIHQATESWLRQKKILYDVELQAPAWTLARLAVKPKTQEEFPEYELKSSFSDRQALEFKWLVHFRGKLSGVKQWIPFDLKVPERCGATLVQNRDSFRTRLHQDKFFWNQ